ncbi:N-acetylglutamate synthase [Legionella beliardensis]|uniref:N-acetylglutamate synthase n=1 Tax=Legionella beliardensis TaxID=91822 RepID=A0A378I851_9GAMM|nr:GNAT family N-acetyltransferase [Legionella beliardensis]STX28564.1 N-acetylglutamate synthase [Legionella beliardensis]
MINIRLAQFNDLNSLNHLIQLSARELSRKDYSVEEINSAIEYVFGVDTELVLDQTYYVLEKDNQLVGCGGWSKRKTLFGGNQFKAREDAAYLNPLQEAAKIRAFFIHPQFARQGLGSILLQHCEYEATQQSFMSFEMMATLPGVKLYRAAGYQWVKDIFITLPNGIEVRFVKMSKSLKG